MVKSLPVIWKIIYLCRFYCSLHATECGRWSSKILYLQIMCGVWTSFQETSALLKLLQHQWSRIWLLVQQWNGHYLSLAWTFLNWNWLFSILFYYQYKTYRNKRDSFYCLQATFTVDTKHHKLHQEMLFVVWSLSILTIEYQTNSKWNVVFHTIGPPCNKY